MFMGSGPVGGGGSTAIGIGGTLFGAAVPAVLAGMSHMAATPATTTAAAAAAIPAFIDDFEERGVLRDLTGSFSDNGIFNGGQECPTVMASCKTFDSIPGSM